MQTVLFDSSIYISVLNPKDKFHETTREFIKKFEPEEIQIVVPTLIILEVGNILLKIRPELKVDDILSIFEGGVVVEIDEEFSREALPLFKKVDLKTSDAIIVAAAKLQRATLFSWDRRLVGESARIVESYSPEDY